MGFLAKSYKKFNLFFFYILRLNLLLTSHDILDILCLPKKMDFFDISDILL